MSSPRGIVTNTREDTHLLWFMKFPWASGMCMRLIQLDFAKTHLHLTLGRSSYVDSASQAKILSNNPYFLGTFRIILCTIAFQKIIFYINQLCLTFDLFLLLFQSSAVPIKLLIAEKHRWWRWCCTKIGCIRIYTSDIALLLSFTRVHN